MNDNEKQDLANEDQRLTHEKEASGAGKSENDSTVSDFLNAIGFSSFIKQKSPKPEVDPVKSESTDTVASINAEQTESADQSSLVNAENETYEADADEQEQFLAIEAESMDTAEKAIKKPIRLFKFAVAGLAVVTVVATLYYFWPYLTEPKPPGEDVVAEYNGKYITIDDMNDFIAMENMREWEHAYCEVHGYDHSKCTPDEPCESHPIDSLEGYREMVSRMATEQIILEWAAKKGITQREDVRHGLKDLLDDASVGQLVEQIHEQELTAESIPKWEVQQYYDTNRSTYGEKEFSEVEHEIRDILAQKKDEEFFPQYIEELKKTAGLEANFDLLKVSEPTSTDITDYYAQNLSLYQTPETAEFLEIKMSSGNGQAEEAIRKLRSGDSFENVASLYGENGEAKKRTVQKGSSDTALEDIVWNMTVGEVSDLITAADGSVNIIKLVSVAPAGARPLSEVRDGIAATLRLENMEREYTLRKDEALFSVHSRRYTLGDFYTEFKELPQEYQTTFSTFETKKQLVEQFIAKELLLEEVGDSSRGTGDQHSLDEIRVQYLSQVMHQEEVEGKLTDPTDEEMLEFYNKNKSKLITPAGIKISFIWIDEGLNGEKKEQARKKAEEALSLINAGIDFAEVAKRYSEDGTAQSGGYVDGWLYQDYLPQELISIFSLQAGQVSEPIESNYGLYIVKVIEKTDQQQMSYEDSLETIKHYLTELKHEQLTAELENNLLNDSGLIIYEKTLRKMIESRTK